MFIGKKIKELRKAKGMTLVELAQASGVQVATISRMENLKMTGTLESHFNIAKALEVDITQLYSDIISEEEKEEIDQDDQSADLFVYNDKSSFEILTSKVLSKRMMPILLKIEPNGKTNIEQNKPGTEKFIFILEGEIEAHIGQSTHILSENNTLYFDASLEHYFANLSDITAKIICVSTPVSL